MATNEPTRAARQIPAIDPGTGHAQDIEARVIAQTVRDPVFRARVLAEPRAVFAEMGLNIPPEIEIQTLEETAEQYYLVLPAGVQAGAGTSLSDAQLEAVAGGGSGAYPPTGDTLWTGCGSGQSGCVANPAGAVHDTSGPCQ